MEKKKKPEGRKKSGGKGAREGRMGKKYGKWMKRNGECLRCSAA